MPLNFQAVNRKRTRELRDAITQRLSEVSRIANDIQKEHGCTRNEALIAADKLVPRS